MRTDAFAKKLLDNRNERRLFGQLDSVKGKFCSVEAAIQRAGIEGFWRGNLLVLEQVLPKCIYELCLLYADFGELCIGPCDGAVAVELRPVAVPCWSTIEGFSSIVKAFAVAAHEDKAVALIARRLLVQGRDVVSKTLPLGRFLAVWAGRVSWIGAVDEAEVAGGEVERGRVGRVVILLKDASNDRVVDVLGVAVGIDGRSCRQEAVQERRGKHCQRL